jgi:geranylgeranyl transferase type-1 subunit beta
MQSFHTQRLLILYFCVTSEDLLSASSSGESASAEDIRNQLYEELRRCYDSSGGFAAEPLPQYGGHFITTPTLTLTHCALSILNSCGRLQAALADWLSAEKTRNFIASCQILGESFPLLACRGGFAAFPGSAEIDARFSYSAMVALQLLQPSGERLNKESSAIAWDDAQEFILKCWSRHEGGFGGLPHHESHGGMTFCCIASLALMGFFNRTEDPRSTKVRHGALRYCAARAESFEGGATGGADDVEEREGSGGAALIGFQGRPNKPCDSCYTHWIGCSLSYLWSLEPSWTSAEPTVAVDVDEILNFVLSCFDSEHGGFSKYAGCSSDPLHSCLALSGLSCLGQVKDLKRVHPLYGCSQETFRMSCLPNV